MEVGDLFSFCPTAFQEKTENFRLELDITVTGRIVQINEEHRWFRVEYDLPMPGCKGHETFKF